ncbi:hypothetical protein H112_06988 [Trichophyton rubrum D6]|uniref:CENP-V/GFA domain-containing protein n=3 Tax=Trichophyton TaxID=5550 RepID=F2SGM0_TRIRC|nr:uncharacterized protein TERG_02332 [Trichophyton rubrum CBS 118892]EZF11925.1 hypothetical protein H100_07012 [Trichophyton rubrum MR850]EZF38784.1 hypothetical protein H102_06973 [Trichophyton rubrum CBS 100081]EZF49418.1 hypothetical protein H103_06997 [Trichophyton rubrum CBS 288.86]EZF60084.1 hypothetical protein H104_06951 [Trichophyton rubrum CBS 289.86]EZF70548.1 hypothetical protein H105_07010 [Trichophyton soudanense CBS 452.61]EZF81430.1 hypothetical protein H110_06992 [Trichophy
MSIPIPNGLTGGCLCKEIQYTIEIPKDISWPPDPHTCWCTQCRKAAGSIIAHLITFDPSTVKWNGTPTEFESSAQGRRGFCPKCGTSLYFRDIGLPAEIEICTGSLDEDILENPQLAKDLCDPSCGRFWCKREIKSTIYENSAGKRWLEGSKSRLMYNGE